ncbi:ERF family protein [Alcaligenes phenolicus]|uniref:ERF family protein n=1 Tax=Alcaligenes phenolicus TaxID=232846 RepID=UPI002AA84433|nr:ERF family protein [Alcaligenes phenolicus]
MSTIPIIENRTTIADHPGRNALFAALAVAQGAFPEIKKNRLVQIRPRDSAPYSFRYADLSVMRESVKQPLADNGLFVIQPINDLEGRVPEAVIETILGHKDGGTVTSRLKVANDFHDPKAFGAVVTYLRRYAYGAILGLTSDDDLDEDGAPVQDAPAKGKSNDAARPDKPAARTEPGGLPECTPDTFEQKTEGWKRLVTAGKPVADMIAMIETKTLLTDEQKAEIASWAKTE